MFARSVDEERSYCQPGSDLVDAGANDDGMAKTDIERKTILDQSIWRRRAGRSCSYRRNPEIGLPRVQSTASSSWALKHDAVQSGSE
jgi:hypothetical protein